MRLLVAGGTGFIGSPLCLRLIQAGHELTVLTRFAAQHRDQERMRFLSWEKIRQPGSMEGMEGLINFSGESIAARRWTDARKARLQESRVQTTRGLVDAIAASAAKPSVLINASAIGYYGARGEEKLSEAAPRGEGFLARLCQEWESEAERAEALGVRVVRLRIGVVLAPGGGALAKMVLPFRFFLGGPLGNGRQWVSWIHRQDLIKLVEWVLEHPEVSGALNATAPEPVTMANFCHTLGWALNRPSWAPVPAPILRLALGEMAQMLLTGQRVMPVAAVRGGFSFQFPSLEEALRVCF